MNSSVPTYLWENIGKNQGKAESSRKGLGLSEVTTLPLDGGQLWGLAKCSPAGAFTPAGPPSRSSPWPTGGALRRL